MLYYNSKKMIEEILNSFDINDNTRRVLKNYINRYRVIDKCNKSYKETYLDIKKIYDKVDSQLDLIYLGKQKILSVIK